MQANQRESDLMDIIEACSYAEDSIKPLIAGALDKFLMEEYADTRLDHKNYQVLTERVWLNFWTDAPIRRESSVYPPAILYLATELALFEERTNEFDMIGDEDEKTLVNAEVAAFVHHAHREFLDKTIQPVMYDFIFEWAERIYFE